MAQQSSNIPEIQETSFKALQNEEHQCGARYGVVDTQIFSCLPTHLWVKKRHSLTLNTKVLLQLAIQTALVQDILLMTKKCVYIVRLKNYFKSINQIRPVLMP